MSIKAVIFDLDGTITQSLLDFDAIREEMGLGKNSGPVWEAMEKMTPQQRHRASITLDLEDQVALPGEFNQAVILCLLHRHYLYLERP